MFSCIMQDLTRKNLLLTWMHADSVKTMETFVEKQFSIIESNNIDSFSAELQTLYGTQ